MKQDQIDVRGIVQLGGSELAKCQHNPSASRHAGCRDHRLVGDLATPRRPSEQICHGRTKRAFCGIAQPDHLCFDRCGPGHIGKGDGKRALLAKPPDRLDHRVIVADFECLCLKVCHGRGDHIAVTAGQDILDDMRMRARQPLKVARMGENSSDLRGVELAAVRHMATSPFCQFGQDAGMRIQRARRAGNKPV